MTNIDEKVLIDAGMSAEQAKIYIFLLENGMTNAKVISVKTNIGRALVYKILDQLIHLEIVIQRDDIGKISLFHPAHPSIIKNYVEKNRQKVELATENFEKTFSLLASKYNILSGKPNIKFLEGLSGLKSMYEDVLQEGKDIKLIRSLLDHKDINTAKILKEHMKKQSELGIKVKLIGPRREDIDIEETIKRDTERLVTRKTISDNFLIPSQIIIYGDKVAITDFKGDLVITIIENPDVRETFEKMFDFMFESIKDTY